MPASMSTPRKASTASGWGVCVMDAGAWIPGDQVDLGIEAGAAKEAGQFTGVLGTVGCAAQQDIFKGEALAGTELELSDGVEQRRDGPLAVDGHDLGADGVVGGVEADGQLGANLRGFSDKVARGRGRFPKWRRSCGAG